MKKNKVIAKHDLLAFPHTWTKGLDYELVQKSDYFVLASDKGQINYKNTVKEDVMQNFIEATA